jgi:hypothetical protein
VARLDQPVSVDRRDGAEDAEDPVAPGYEPPMSQSPFVPSQAQLERRRTSERRGNNHKMKGRQLGGLTTLLLFVSVILPRQAQGFQPVTIGVEGALFVLVLFHRPFGVGTLLSQSFLPCSQGHAF